MPSDPGATEKAWSPPATDDGVQVDNFEIDPAKERRLVRKLDLHIIPVVMLLYMLSFLDR